MHVIRLFLLILSVLVSSRTQARVYDCFLFFNELDLLEIRLHEMNDVVDRFVIVESVETFQGHKKPLYFQENRGRFVQFNDKIIHVVLEERQKGVDPWVREHFQRDQILRGLNGCQDADVIIIGDVDEIIRSSLIPDVVLQVKKDSDSLFVAVQNMHRFFLNTYYEVRFDAFPPIWGGSVITSFLQVKALGGPQMTREMRCRGTNLENGGWHFSSLGGKEAVALKNRSYSHSAEHLWQGPVKSFDDLVNHPNHFIRCEITEDYPKFILDHLPYFQEIGFIF